MTNNLELCFFIDSTWYGIKSLNKESNLGFKYRQMANIMNPDMIIRIINELLSNYQLQDFKYDLKEIKLYFSNNIILTLKQLVKNKDNLLKKYLKIIVDKYEVQILKTNYLKVLIHNYNEQLFKEKIAKMSREEILNLINTLNEEELINLISHNYLVFKISNEGINVNKLLKI